MNFQMAAIEVDNKISQELKAQIKYIKQEINTLTHPLIQNLTYYSSSSPSSTSDSDDSEDSESEPNNNNSAHESTEAVEESISIDNSDTNYDNNNNTKESIIYNPEPTEAINAEEVDISIDSSINFTIEPIVIHDDESIQIPCSSQYNNINTACLSQDFNINTSINKAKIISRGKYPMKRKLDSIIDGVQQNTKLQKQDNIEQTLKTIMAHIEKIDKRLDNLENKSVITPNNTEDNTRNNTQKRDTPLQIKNSRNQVIVAFRDFWMPGITKRFDDIEARLDSIEESSESIKQK